MAIKKLIEVALPLEKINAESVRDKSLRHGHPSTLHFYWARRPLAAARAVIWASLVDDPSSHPELFPTEETQESERNRLFKILEDLVLWENSNNEKVLATAKAEIMKYTNGNPPVFLDPFAGGGAIPLEAQRLGLEAHAHDLNPVAVLINKAMIEIPPRFAGMEPVNPKSRSRIYSNDEYSGVRGLAEDVQYYGEWMKEEAFKRIGKFYPTVTVQTSHGSSEAKVIAWIWARTVKCPNPACGCEMPLVKTFNVCQKNDKERYVSVEFDAKKAPVFHVYPGLSPMTETVNRKGGICAHCGAPVDFDYIREEFKAKRISSKLMAVVYEGEKGKEYVTPSSKHIEAAKVPRPEDSSLGPLAFYPGYINPVAYGFTDIDDLFTNRQLTMLSTFEEILHILKEKIQQDAKEIHIFEDTHTLNDAGKGAIAYAEAICIYLSFVIDKLADYHSSICSWHNSGEKIGHSFGMTGMSMRWDYCEANPFSEASGCFDNMLEWVVRYIQNSPNNVKYGVAIQQDAQIPIGLQNIMISTDPPYYSNVPYADFSDFFYTWLRRGLKDIYPSLFATLQTPKAEELVADPYRAGSKKAAAEHFENGMLQACQQMYSCVCDDIPVTIYYAYKQNDSEQSKNGEKVEVSTGWEKMLAAILKAGFTITGTWPVRTEMANRSRGIGSNALASSIVLVCRKRPTDAPSCTRRNFIAELKRELRPALKKLQAANIAPVDMAQSAIGPGMAVYSKYTQVLEADGAPMTIRSALQIINQELDIYFNEQDGELDKESRFCVELYSQNAFNDMKFGDADNLARAKNTAVAILASAGVLYAAKGIVHLLERTEIPQKVSSRDKMIWLLTQQLTHAMETGGIVACATMIAPIVGSSAEYAKTLAYRLYQIAERNSWTQEALAYNNLVTSWPEIQSKAAEIQASKPVQLTLFDD